jgi:hypothetical protein
MLAGCGSVVTANEYLFVLNFLGVKKYEVKLTFSPIHHQRWNQLCRRSA